MDYYCDTCDTLVCKPFEKRESSGEKFSVCPRCGGDLVRALVCDECGRHITGEYIETKKGYVICDDCYNVFDITENEFLYT